METTATLFRFILLVTPITRCYIVPNGKAIGGLPKGVRPQNGENTKR